MPVNIPAYLCVLLMLTSACTGIPDNASPVSGFDVNRYLGTWYEIAWLDHSFERGLERVTAEYSLRDDGGIRVVNQGFHRSSTMRSPHDRSAKHPHSGLTPAG
jgi:apolipoprotein D and lipocalin family protein